jgi:hypothetical protein
MSCATCVSLGSSRSLVSRCKAYSGQIHTVDVTGSNPVAPNIICVLPRWTFDGIHNHDENTHSSKGGLSGAPGSQAHCGSYAATLGCGKKVGQEETVALRVRAIDVFFFALTGWQRCQPFPFAQAGNVRASEKRSHFRRRRPGPVSQPERAPVGGDAVRTLQ